MDPILAKLADRTARVVVVGQGYVGLPVAIRSTEVGFTTVGFDLSKQRVDSLRNGVSFVGDISDEQLQRALASGYTPTDDPELLAGFDVAVISVPTPLREGMPDLTYIEDAGRAVGRHLRAGGCVILESTTYPARPPSCSARSSKPHPGWHRAITDSATRPSASTRATPPTPSSTRRR